MNDIFNKISSYNLFNYLFPGILFVVISAQYTSFNFTQPDLILGLFVYYFIGLLVSRIGSILVEPLLKRVKFLKFADYSKYLVACKNDPKIEILSEVNNTYRSIIAVIVSVFILKGYDWLLTIKTGLRGESLSLVLVLLLILFLLSYRKQTHYITRRINKK